MPPKITHSKVHEKLIYPSCANFKEIIYEYNTKEGRNRFNLIYSTWVHKDCNFISTRWMSVIEVAGIQVSILKKINKIRINKKDIPFIAGETALDWLGLSNEVLHDSDE